ncbi:uncharacterized protein LOC122798400 [Protopterus annectens]|uniref:uncharacterized protein LOC122798400 n=1 Tax=Protopterus annectens TaxID=7888 RepID=UPI001CFB625C|nr:uncharacterized protein LOC122798400 [Protopterus annectens]
MTVTLYAPSYFCRRCIWLKTCVLCSEASQRLDIMPRKRRRCQSSVCNMGSEIVEPDNAISTDVLLSSDPCTSPNVVSSNLVDLKRLTFFPFNSLPADCQLHIFSFLSEVEKCRAALVCQSWSVLMRTPRLWRVADFVRLGAFHSGIDEVLVSTREFERWKEWVYQYAYHLTSRSASLMVLHASFDLSDQKSKWKDFLLHFLEGIHCNDLEVLDLNWTLTYLEPIDFGPQASMTGASLVKMEQMKSFQVLLEKLTRSSPKLTKMKLPFDWSQRSVTLLSHFKQLSTLELKYFWVFKGVCPSIMRELTNSLPNLKNLTLHVLVPVRDLGISYALESRSLEFLDVSQSHGLVFGYLHLPSLKELRIKKAVRGIILNRRTRLALQSKWTCLYDLLKKGTPNLQLINGEKLLPQWREFGYHELHAILLQSCYCLKHSDTWLL